MGLLLGWRVVPVLLMGWLLALGGGDTGFPGPGWGREGVPGPQQTRAAPWELTRPRSALDPARLGTSRPPRWLESGVGSVVQRPWSHSSLRRAPLPSLQGNEPVEPTIQDTLPRNLRRRRYALDLDTSYSQLTVRLSWKDPRVDLDLTVVDALEAPTIVARSAQAEGTSEEVTLEAVPPGRYFVLVERAGGPSRPVEITVEIQGEPEEPAEAPEVEEPSAEGSEPPEGPPVLVMGERVTGELGDGAVRLFRLNAEAHHRYRIVVRTPEPGVFLDLGVGLRPPPAPSLARLDRLREGETVVVEADFIAPAEGIYTVWVGRNDLLSPADSAQGTFTLSVTDLGRPPTISAEVTTDEIGSAQSLFFLLPVERPGAFLSVLLLGPEMPEVEMDLSLVLYDEEGQEVVAETSAGLGPNEILVLPQAPTGVYVITVNRYGDTDDDPVPFTLVTQLEDPVELVQVQLELVNQSGGEICRVAADPTDEPEGQPLLLLEEPLAPGARVTVEVPVNRYVLAAYDCQDVQVGETWDAEIVQDMSWEIR